VALKIGAVEASKFCAEVEMLQYLARLDLAEHPVKNFITLLLDHFWIEGPNRRYMCLVSEVLGQIVAQLRADNVVLSIHQAQTVALKTSQALAYLHAVGIGHGGL
jgi:hypothetical protein